MDKEFLNKFQHLDDVATAIYLEATKEYKVVMTWSKDENFVPLTIRDIDKFEKSFAATQSSVSSAFAACERLTELLKEMGAELEEKEREIEHSKYLQSDEFDTDDGDFRSDAEREAGIPKRGYF